MIGLPARSDGDYPIVSSSTAVAHAKARLLAWADDTDARNRDSLMSRLGEAGLGYATVIQVGMSLLALLPSKRKKAAPAKVTWTRWLTTKLMTWTVAACIKRLA